MSTFLQDLRYGFRMLLKSPGFTAIAVLAIALGIGANTTIFSCVNALLLRPFSFGNQERLMAVWERLPELEVRRGSVAPGNFADWRDQNGVFDETTAYHPSYFNLAEGEQPERVPGARVAPNFFRTLDVRPASGRAFSDEEGQAGREQVVLVKQSLWQRRFASDPKLVGKTLMLDGRPYTVVGIVGQDFNFPDNNTELWAPLAFNEKEKANRGNHYLRVIGRLKPGATREQAQAELTAVSERAQQQFPETNGGRTAFVESLNESHTRGPRPYLIVLLGAVGFVLLIACANVANLLLVRATARQKEMALRMALGASRRRIVRQLLTESLLLSVVGGATGLLLSVWGIEFIRKGIPPGFTQYIPGWNNLRLDTPVLLYTAAITLVTGAVFGLAPALQATRANFNEALKEGGKGSGGAGGRNRLRSILVVAEVALSLVLLVGAGLMIRSFVHLMRTELGVNPANVLTMELSLPRAKYGENQQSVNFYNQLLRRVEALPGVSRAAVVNYIPMSRNNTGSSFRVAGQPAPPAGRAPLADYRVVSPGYFEAIGTELRQGRAFEGRDAEGAPRVVVVNERLARRYFPGGDALGKHLILDDESKPLEIVGVSADVKDDDFDEQAEMTMYIPFLQQPWRSMSLVVRTGGDPTLLAPAVRSEVRALDAEQPVYNVRTMQQVIDETLSPKRLMVFLLGFFAFGALVLAAVGIYAVMSYTVTQRTHELGVRMALGAQPRDILGMVVRQGLVLIAVGLAVGLGGAFLLTRLMSEILSGVSATDPVTFVGIPLLLAAVALLASFIPARKATKVDPMVALRHE